jgi:hypothetical protein
VEWVDVDDALKLVNLSDVDVDDDGNIDRRDLRLAMKDLAKRKPHLVKAKKTDDGNDGENDDKSSGSRMNGRRRGQRTGVDREASAKRFPVLRQ